VTAEPDVRTGTLLRGSRKALGILSSRGAPVLVLALSAALAAYQVGRKSLWHDEAFTLAVARGDGETFRHSVLGGEAFAALYYSVVRLLPLGDGEAALRVPSVLFAVLAALTCYALARELFGARVAAIAAVLLSINVLFVRYAQEARAYALALWLVVLAGWLLLRAVQRPTWARWLTFGALSALAGYAHFFAVFVLAGQLLSLAPLRSTLPVRRVAAAAGLAACLLLPLAVVLARTNEGGREKLPQASVGALAADLAGISPMPLGAVQAAVLALCATGAAIVGLRRRGAADPFSRWRYWMLAGWIGGPLALAGLVSVFWPVFVTRYFLVCLPAVVLLLAVGLDRARPALRAVALLLVLLAAAQPLHGYYLQTYKDGENWRGLVQHVADRARPGDSAIFLSHYGRRPFEYYLDRHAGLAATLTPAYPALPWRDYAPVVGDTRLDLTGDQARLRAAPPRRIWVVLLWGGFGTGDDDGRPFVEILDRAYRQTDQRFYGRYLKLALFDRVTGPADSVIGGAGASLPPDGIGRQDRPGPPKVRAHLALVPNDHSYQLMEDRSWLAVQWSPGGPASWDPTSAIVSSTRATRSPVSTTSSPAPRRTSTTCSSTTGSAWSGPT
jgi:mannosyltransferase